MSSPAASPPATPPGTPRRSSDRVRTRIRRQRVYDCFGDQGPEELSPVQALGKLSAVAMLTTVRVGDPGEDASMAQARPYLSEVNKRGLVTTDSQMGAKKHLSHHFDGHVLNPPVTQWQRSYISGILAKGLGGKFAQKMRLVDGVDFFLDWHGESPPYALTHDINVTMYRQGDNEPNFFTNVPMATHPLAYSLSGVLPEVEHVLQNDTCVRIVEEDALLVQIVDLVWGRPFWLFEKVKEVLDEVLSEQAP
ncbi:unnamed protein product [Ectocarpus sp. 4 AP-2014]|uniref:EsV-1-229 n=1 Tax=Ectocarpus siliculosus virus 1 (isolate New Zealand/Kaikoura/1988) TaxID=654926 RepID=Q8QN61_ESV1K|nr:EsV-1-229 [Ectocarpus siliculosus virus 1]AAK14642.1 EsV-1-229 [Ectocarpus siliculosus virus 1]